MSAAVFCRTIGNRLHVSPSGWFAPSRGGCSDAHVSHALQAMLNVADEAGGTQDPGPRAATRPALTAFVSLVHACTHAQCREQLRLLGIQGLLDRLGTQPDPAINQYRRRVQVRGGCTHVSTYLQTAPRQWGL